ncbi:MAG TPA: nuclear transport factor 2 family protein [Actinocatenispora sp.]
MDIEEAQRFAADWEERWNSHDLDRVLAHYADDVVFRSPYAVAVIGTDTVRGKDALRAYWTAGLKRLPDLRFTVESVQVCPRSPEAQDSQVPTGGDSTLGLDTVVINYRNQVGQLISEVLTLRDGAVVSGFGAYGPVPV